MASSPLFSVRRRPSVLVCPAKPTPQEFKPLSDVDNKDGFRTHVQVMFLFGSRDQPLVQGCGGDPARVIRDAIAEALVYYYPLAGRLRELPSRGSKLVVECNGEGVLFIEADADFGLDQLGDDPQPPFPCTEELVYRPDASQPPIGIIDGPLLLIQVTRLRCGGFFFAISMNHMMADAFGLAMFITAMAEMVRLGVDAPSVIPVWEREVLTTQVPKPTALRLTHQDSKGGQLAAGNLVQRSIFLCLSEIEALRQRLSSPLRSTTWFEAVTACVWRSRAIALGPDHLGEQASVKFPLNMRFRKIERPLPAGYYGNAMVVAIAQCTTAELCHSPVEHAVRLVREAKANSVNCGTLQSVLDLIPVVDRRMTQLVVSDLTKWGMEEVDLGWGKPMFVGIPLVPFIACLYTRSRSRNDEDGIRVSLSLPAPAMERFVVEVEGMTKLNCISRSTSSWILSSL